MMDVAERQKLALEEQSLLRDFLLSRVKVGVDLRYLVMAHCALLGQAVGQISQTGHLEPALEMMISTMRYNAILAQPAAGNA